MCRGYQTEKDWAPSCRFAYDFTSCTWRYQQAFASGRNHRGPLERYRQLPIDNSPRVYDSAPGLERSSSHVNKCSQQHRTPTPYEQATSSIFDSPLGCSSFKVARSVQLPKPHLFLQATEQATESFVGQSPSCASSFTSRPCAAGARCSCRKNVHGSCGVPRPRRRERGATAAVAEALGQIHHHHRHRRHLCRHHLRCRRLRRRLCRRRRSRRASSGPAEGAPAGAIMTGAWTSAWPAGGNARPRWVAWSWPTSTSAGWVGIA